MMKGKSDFKMTDNMLRENKTRFTVLPPAHCAPVFDSVFTTSAHYYLGVWNKLGVTVSMC